jgi:aryl-alcohol dehydrogenase-like predicted oxidoreductase
METRKLDGTDEDISVLGLGTWPLAGQMGAVDRSGATRLIRSAVDRGVTLVDTAEAYGDTESILGEALREGYREKVFLATKVSRDFSREGVRRAAETSLRALNTDRIDLYQLHRYEEAVPLEESLEELIRLNREGHIRYIGVSNFNKEQLRRALKAAPVVSNQINYNALNRAPEEEHLDYCRERGVSVIGHSSLAKGLLTGKYKPGHRFAPDDERSDFPGYYGDALAHYLAAVESVAEVARGRGLTPTQAAISWVLAREEVASVLVGPKNEKQLAESIEAAGALSPAERGELRKDLDGVLHRHNLPPLCPFPDQLV